MFIFTGILLLSASAPEFALQSSDSKIEAGSLLALPFSRGKKIFTTRMAGEGKPVFCVQVGPEGHPKVILDSATDVFLLQSPPQNFDVSDDGRYLNYYVPQIPRRFEEIRTIDTASGKAVDEPIQWTYMSDMDWRGRGFYYGKYPKPANAAGPDFATQAGNPSDHLNEQLFFHQMGTPSSADELVYSDPDHPKQKYLFLEGFNHRWFHLHKLPTAGRTNLSSEWFSLSGNGKLKLLPIQGEMAPGRFLSSDPTHDKFLMYTTFHSLKGRVVLIDSANPQETHWKTVIAERGERLVSADPACGKLILTYNLAQGGNRVEIHGEDGRFERNLPIEPGSTAEIQWCSPKEKEFFVSVKKGKEPPKYYRYSPGAAALTPFN